MARVLVTGGAGFLGSHLCDALLARGDEVVAIDNLLTGSVDNIEHLFGQPGFTFVDHDVSQYVWVPGPVDAVLHLAPPLICTREELEELAAKTEAVLADASERFFAG